MSPLYQRVGCHQAVPYAEPRKVKRTGIANWDAVGKATKISFNALLSDSLRVTVSVAPSAVFFGRAFQDEGGVSNL